MPIFASQFDGSFKVWIVLKDANDFFPPGFCGGWCGLDVLLELGELGFELGDSLFNGKGGRHRGGWGDGDSNSSKPTGWLTPKMADLASSLAWAGRMMGDGGAGRSEAQMIELMRR
jgi:hypothetical protein